MLAGGGLNITAGSGTVTIDSSQRVPRANAADVTFQLSQFIYVRGSFAFENGATMTVPLVGGGNASVETMTIGTSGAHVFVGVSGPYWQDTNNSGGIDAGDTPSADAVGLALENVDVGLLVAKETTESSPVKYTSLKVTATSARTVGMDAALTVVANGVTVGYNTTNDAAKPAINFQALTGGGLSSRSAPARSPSTSRVGLSAPASPI